MTKMLARFLLLKLEQWPTGVTVLLAMTAVSSLYDTQFQAKKSTQPSPLGEMTHDSGEPTPYRLPDRQSFVVPTSGNSRTRFAHMPPDAIRQVGQNMGT